MTDQGSGSGGQGFGGEDASRARDHVRAAEENRDALAAGNQRTENTTSGDVDMPRVDAAGRGTTTTAAAGASGQGSDDSSRAREHVHAAEENRDALAAQNRQTESTAPRGVDMPSVDSGRTDGMDATGASTQASEDPSRAREHVRAAEENRDALAEESRRVESSTPPDVSTGR
ncbi:MAG TPA: hypothetical protein VEX86_08110 [Longimicrobium sp.]|nr:hypothetical protein [Longimicrobium sp.]